MKISRMNLLFIATLLFLAIPLIITGNAGAVYLSDGAVQNSAGGWDLPSDLGTCYDGTITTGATADPSATPADCFNNVDASVLAADQTTCTTAGFKWSHGACTNNWKFQYTYSGNNQCLRCHNTAYMGGRGALQADKSSYLKTGHKNMLRKVQPAGVPDPADLATTNPGARYIAGYPWSGPNASGTLSVYTGDGTNTINFADGSITLASDGSKHNLYWLYGDWIAAAPSAVYGTDAYNGSRTTFGTNNGYTCANCHSTGFQDALSTTTVGIQNMGTYPTVSYTAGEPQASFPSLAAVGGTGVNAKWDLYGIQCSRCHYSTSPAVTPNAAAQAQFGPQVRGTGSHNNSASGQDITNVCFGCHQSTSGVGGSNDPYGTSLDPTKIPVGVSHGAAYGRDFNGHVLGNSFLSSPHAKFTGTFITNPLNEKDIYGNTASQYASVFAGAECSATAGIVCNEETKGSCVTCHDVHQSLVIAGNEPIRRECEECHAGAQAGDGSGAAPVVDATSIQHPQGTGTPFDTAMYESACVVCHMATQAVENGDQNSMAAHVWRINVNPAYNTFPTMAQFYGGSCTVHAGAVSTNNSYVKVFASDQSSANCTANGGTWTATTASRFATRAADGTYSQAVWVDLDMACGQCHGGSGTATHNGAPYISKGDLASYAAVMHGVPAGTVPPTADATVTAAGGVFATGVVVTLKDASYDPVTAQGSLGVVVDWGDGSQSTGVGGGTLTHTYSIAGTFTIIDTVTNGAGLSASKYIFETISTIAPTTSISGTVYNSFDTSVAAAGVKVKLKNAAGYVKQVVTTCDGSTVSTMCPSGTPAGYYAFANVDFSKGPYSIVAKNVGTDFSYSSITGVSAAASGQDINLNAATIRVGGNYPFAKVIITNGSQTIKKWTSTIVPIGTNTDYFTKFKNLSATAPWTLTVTQLVSGTTTVLNCTVDHPTVDLTGVTLDLSGTTPMYDVTINSCN